LETFGARVESSKREARRELEPVSEMDRGEDGGTEEEH
jgi:hypothetical protein